MVTTTVVRPDGPEVPATVTVWTGTEEVAPVSSGVMPAGYAHTADMLSRPAFVVGHRGASVDFPEGSLRGYTEAAARGVGALELSLNRSSDGMWFALHDQTLDRTSGVTGMPAASSMTWEQIRAHRIVVPAGQPSQPYMAAAELVEAYGSSHVLFVDPKYRHADSRQAFWDLLATIPDATDRVVVKYYGDNTGLATAARQRGYTTWGYYYEADLASGLLAQTHGAWDILGMAYYAPVAAWDAILGYAGQRPVMGHICPNAAAATQALTRGASGLMVSGVRAVVADQPTV